MAKTPKDLGLKEQEFSSLKEVTDAYNAMVKRLNNVHRYAQIDIDIPKSYVRFREFTDDGYVDWRIIVIEGTFQIQKRIDGAWVYAATWGG
jgi:hypothetical protein